jgi:hypothetical protein
MNSTGMPNAEISGRRAIDAEMGRGFAFLLQLVSLQSVCSSVEENCLDDEIISI